MDGPVALDMEAPVTLTETITDATEPWKIRGCGHGAQEERLKGQPVHN